MEHKNFHESNNKELLHNLEGLLTSDETQQKFEESEKKIILLIERFNKSEEIDPEILRKFITL